METYALEHICLGLNEADYNDPGSDTSNQRPKLTISKPANCLP